MVFIQTTVSLSVATITIRNYGTFQNHSARTVMTAFSSAQEDMNTKSSYLVIPLTEELQALRSLVHEDPVQVARLHGADLNGLLSPAHDLVGADVSYGERKMGKVAQLNLDILACMSVRVCVCARVFTV